MLWILKLYFKLYKKFIFHYIHIRYNFIMNNKVIWITGASSGIGKALAIKFANESWQVAASARRENLLKELNEKYPNIHSFPLDVTDSEKC